MTRTVKKLSGLEIDEVSLVDRPANQHGLVAIAKRQEDGMTIFDGQGNEVDETELEHGDVVYDEAGTELVFVEEDDTDDGDDEVGKGFGDGIRLRGMYAADKVRGAGAYARYKAPELKHSARRGARRAEERGRRALGADRATAYSSGKARGQSSAFAEGQGRAGRAFDRASGSVAGQYGAHPYAATGGAAAGTGGGVAYGVHRRKERASKSLGDYVLEDLSKALTDEARDEVIAKAADQFEDIAKRNEQLEDLVYSLIEDREAEQYEELAKSYDIGDPSEVGGLLYRASQVLPAEDVAALDRVFSGYGEISKGYMEEIGYNGYGDSDTMAQVAALAGEVISKSSGAMSQEQAVTALFDANPAAYDEYEAEQRLR